MQDTQASKNLATEAPVTLEKRRSPSACVRAMRRACQLLLLLAVLSQPVVTAAQSVEIGRAGTIHVSSSSSW